MTVYKVHNGPANVTGDGDDVLSIRVDQPGAVHTSSFGGSLADGYSGRITTGAGDIQYSGIQSFSFHDTAQNADQIQTGAGNDTIFTGALDDTISSGGGSDVINGGSGVDKWSTDLSALTSSIHIDLSSGKHQHFGDGGSVVNVEDLNITTGSGDDYIREASAGSGSIVHTGGGNDTVQLNLKSYGAFDGGAGNDTFVLVGDEPGGVSLQVTDVGGGHLSGIVYGDEGGSTISLTDVENYRFTDLAGGNDAIDTLNGNDTIRTGAGDDTISSGRGRDIVDGGAGQDTWGADKSDLTHGMVIDFDSDAVQKIHGGGSVAGIETVALVCGSGNDLITSSSHSIGDSIEGMGGDDTLSSLATLYSTLNGGFGEDRLILHDVGTFTALHDDTYGGYRSTGEDGVLFQGMDSFSLYCDDDAQQIVTYGGRDLIEGAGGDDSLSAGDGRDTLAGGAGQDQLSGGAGKDLFVFRAISDSSVSAPDTILDLAKGDRIDLSAIDANANLAGDQAFVQVHHFDGVAGEATLAYDVASGRTLLSLDSNGDGQADSVIAIAGDHHDFHNFVL